LHPADLQRIAVVPHGHYIGSYPNTVSRAEARARLGIPDGAFVFLMLGLLRPYKGLEELLPAFRSITDPDALLLVAGKAGDADYMSRLSGLAAGDPRIWLRPGFVATEDVQVHMNAADVCVLPYRQITTSGAAVLAFSFGRPVVAPRLGAFSSLVDQSRGVLYDPAGQAALAAALEQARQTDWMGSAPEIRAWVAQCDWTAIGEQLLAAYRTALGRSERRAASGDS